MLQTEIPEQGSKWSCVETCKLYIPAHFTLCKRLQGLRWYLYCRAQLLYSLDIMWRSRNCANDTETAQREKQNPVCGSISKRYKGKRFLPPWINCGFYENRISKGATCSCNVQRKTWFSSTKWIRKHYGLYKDSHGCRLKRVIY